MDSRESRKQTELREWMARMNWASDAERNLFLLACVCSVLLPPLGIASLGLPLSLLLLGSHVLLLLWTATNVQRKFAIASSLIVIISLVNFLLANYSGLQHAELLIYAFTGLALLSLPFGIIGYGKAQREARQALEFTEKDEFRWMLTSAPLLPRWRFSELLREKRILG